MRVVWAGLVGEVVAAREASLACLVGEVVAAREVWLAGLRGANTSTQMVHKQYARGLRGALVM